MRCMRAFFVLAVALLFTASVQGQVTNPDNGHQYLLVDGGYTWYQANDSAQKLGGHLVSITSAEEQNFVETLIYPEGVFWIGATDSAEEGTWVWTSGELWGYTNWYPGEPNNSAGIEHFATVLTRMGYTGEWNDYGAMGSAAFIVEWTPVSYPVAQGINYGPDALGNYVFTTTPTIYWTYTDDPPSTQVAFEIQVGIDLDWSVAELWNPGPISTSDTSVMYAGSPLSVPGTYYIRLRTSNGTAWGDWRGATFHVAISGQTRVVPDEYPTLAEAFAAALPFDSIMMRAGTYTGPGFIGLNLPDDPIVLLSESGPALTILDAAGSVSSILKVDGGADSFTVISGLSFVNADSTALVLVNAAPKIVNCVFRGQQTSAKGAAISSFHSNSPIYRGCVFEGNVSTWCGGALSFDNSGTPLVQDCRFSGNQAPFGGAVISVYSDVTFTGCAFTGNTATGDGAASYNQNGGFHRFVNCTFFGNAGTNTNIAVIRALTTAQITNCIITSTPVGRAVSIGTASVSLACTDIYGNANGDWTPDIAGQLSINGNLAVDPLICDETSLAIPEYSPCAPANNSCAVLIGSGTVGCPNAVISAVRVDGVMNNTHVIADLPVIDWTSSASPQTAFEIAIGTDSNWTLAEMWAPSVFTSSTPSVTYAGLPLVDGTQYFGRIRISDGTEWSSWHKFVFRTNRVPAKPVRISPGVAASTGLTPTLSVGGVVDDAGETLTFDFQVFTDSLAPQPVAEVSGHPGGASASWTVSPALTDNTVCFWRARAYDGYEYSPWMAFAWFGANVAPEAPLAVNLIAPPAQVGKPVYTLLPTFTWHAAVDPDPFDVVRYKLELATDANFVFKIQFDSLTDTSWVGTDSLTVNTHYWWRVSARDLTGLSVQSATGNFWMWQPGDVTGNQVVDVTDLTAIIDAMFISLNIPEMHVMYDVTGDCRVDIADVTAVVLHLFVTFEPLQPGCQ